MSAAEDDPRIARRERIAELYRRFWTPVPRPGEGLPLTPQDHVFQMRGWLDLGQPAETLPAVVLMSEVDELAAREYATLLAEEANEQPEVRPPLNREQMRFIAWNLLQALDEELKPPRPTRDVHARAAQVGESVARSEEWISEADALEIVAETIEELGAELDERFWETALAKGRALLAERKGTL